MKLLGARRRMATAFSLILTAGVIVGPAQSEANGAMTASLQSAGRSGGPGGTGGAGGLTGERSSGTAPAARVGGLRYGAVSGSADGWTGASLPAGVGYLADITCVAASLCVAVGQDSAGTGGVILTSADNGVHWVSQAVPSSVNALFGVSCADTSHCWAVGQEAPSANYAGIVLATTDGGTAWTPQSLPGSPPWLRRVSCVKSSGYRCWAVAPDAGVIYATVNGGATWQLQSFPSPSSGLAVFPEGIDFVTASVGYFAGGDECGGQGVTECPGFIYKTTDGGGTWQLVFHGEPYMDGVSCTDTSHCWAAASTFLTGEVLATANGGASWQPQGLPGFSGEMNDISCSADPAGARCWAIGDNGYQGNNYTASKPVILTTSGGTCWAADSLPGSAGPLYGAGASGAAKAWAVGTNSSASSAQAWYTTSAASPPVVTSLSRTGAPFTGHTSVTIQGCGFTQSSTVSFGSTAAASSTYVSPNQLSATTSAISLYNVGPANVTVSADGLSSTADNRAGFTYYAPEIGRLIFKEGSGEHAECTASVVHSNNQSVVLTAGHCVGGGGSFNTDFAFAPGYYGPVCTGSLSSSAAYLACGTTPYGISERPRRRDHQPVARQW